MQWKLNKSFIHSMCSETDFEKYKEGEQSKGQVSSPVNATFLEPEKEMNCIICSKVGKQCYQTSFEKVFLKEHKSVFTNHLQKFVKSHQVKVIQQHFFPRVQGKQSQNSPISLQLLFCSQGRLDQAQKLKFCNYLQCSLQLREFLDYITITSPSKAALGFIEITYILCLAFSSLQNHNITKKQINDLAIEIAHAQIVVQIDSFSNGYFKQYKDQPQFTLMIEVYCVTVMLVLFEYFQNPFMEENRPNRVSYDHEDLSLSDSDCDSDFSGSILADKCRKKLKSSP